MDLFMPALQDAIEQLEVIHDAWWRVNDALLLPHTGSIWLEVNTVRPYVFDLNAGQFFVARCALTRAQPTIESTCHRQVQGLLSR